MKKFLLKKYLKLLIFFSKVQCLFSPSHFTFRFVRDKSLKKALIQTYSEMKSGTELNFQQGAHSGQIHNYERKTDIELIPAWILKREAENINKRKKKNATHSVLDNLDESIFMDINNEFSDISINKFG